MSGFTDSHPHEQTHASDGSDIDYVGYRQRGRAIVEKHSDQEQLTLNRSFESVETNTSE